MDLPLIAKQADSVKCLCSIGAFTYNQWTIQQSYDTFYSSNVITCVSLSPSIPGLMSYPANGLKNLSLRLCQINIFFLGSTTVLILVKYFRPL